MGTCASKPERTPSGKKASSKPSLSQRDPDSPLEFVLARWNQLPGHATLSKRKLEDLCQASWPKVTTAVRPKLRWPPEGSFNVDRLKTLKKHLREEKPRQLQYLSLFEAAERTVPDCSGRGTLRHLAVLKSKARRLRSQRNLPPPPPYEEPADDSDSFDQSLLPFYYPTATSEDISSEGEIDDEVSGSEGQGRTARASTLAQREKNKKELKTKPKPTSANDGAGPSSQGDAQMPLQGLPIPPSAPDGPPRMVYAHRPFATTDLVTWCLEVFTRAILEGIRAAGKRVVNWTKVQAVQQGPNEHPSDYFSRLTTAIKTWGGINPESPEHEIIVKGFFKDQATPDIRKALNLQIGYDGKPNGEILSIAKTIFNSRDEKTKREGSAEEEKVLALNMEPRGLPQGYVESPAIFSAVFHQDLQDVALPGGSTYLLYVDDILLCSTSEEACRLDTKYLLMELAHKGHKVSPKKLQFCKQEVKYLGHILGVGTRSLATDRIEAVTKIPLPQTKRQLRGFLGMAGFCRSWIAGYAELTKPLTAMTRQDHPDKLKWNEEAYASFERIKRELRSAPALGLPDYRIPFNLYVHEQMGVASGVLTQPFRDRERPVAYYSLQLDNTAKGTVNCLRAIAATATLLEKAQETVLGHEITIHVPHAVSVLLTMKGSHHFSNSRLNRYEALLLTPSNVTIKRVTSLNPATLLPLPDDGTPHHDCAQIVRQAEKPREDLDHLPLPNPDLILYTDGSSRIVDGERKSGYAVVSDFEIIEANPINPQYSAQAAELVALIRACEISEGKRATIYTDSKYCFGLVHTTGQIWLQRGFLTAAGSQISHATLVERLLNAIHLPEAIAVVHCKAHTRGRDPISKGNSRADRAAQMAALQPPLEGMDFQCIQLPADLDLRNIYETITDEELAKWISIGASETEGIWTLPDGRIILPKAWTPKFARILHQQTHWGKGKITDFIQRYCYAPGTAAAAAAATKNCVTCQNFNPKREPKRPPGARPWAFVPFETLQLDFIDLPPCQGFKHALIIVDKFSHWVEGFPTRRATASVVARTLIQEIIPRYGIPRKLDSDQGTHFTAEVAQHVAQALGIKWELHTPYHPESSGQVERMNQEIKLQLGKLCSEMGLKWVNALPLVLHNIRCAPTRALKLSPYELLFGRPPPVYTTQFPLAELDTGEAELTTYVIQLQKQLQRLHAYAAVEATMPLSDQCSGLQTDYHFLDYHTADLGGNQNPDRVGDFNFCLPESRTLLHHSLVPRLSGTQYWELFIRDRQYQRIGSANLTMEQQYYRLRCTNGSYLLYGQGDTLRHPNWTEMERGGANPVYTDNHHPSENLIFGFQCLLLTPKPEKPQLQGILPVTLEQFRSGDMTSWNLTAMNLTHQYLYLTGPTKGPLCRLFTGDGAHIGTSTCTTNIKLHTSGQAIAIALQSLAQLALHARVSR
ncbi:uncharacterized protein LOC132591460 [Zootoca vivipara]|uniref:uncharacterized protein LOC132591460 n=1 Tax=Zootoca vivipara TaxID=8524 RepID=UPI00293BD687|nr:uncharacterized protein LOC132591460 [Zootoca vivipara]